MARYLRIEYPDALYHIMSRGDRKDSVFLNDYCKLKFIEKLQESLIKYNVTCYAFCVMNNHYHIFVKTPDSNIKRFMFQLNTSYTNWYKSKTKKIGHVFQGRYKSILIEENSYALNVADYIHLNPLKDRVIMNLEDYPFSTYLNYISLNHHSITNLDCDFILKYFDEDPEKSHLKYQVHILKKDPNFTLNKRDFYKSTAYGSKSFKKKIEKKIKDFDLDEEIPSLKMNKKRGYKDYIPIFANFYNIEEDMIYKKFTGNNYRKLFVYFLAEYTRMKHREIAKIFGFHYTNVSLIKKDILKDFQKNSKSRKEFINFLKVINI
ncbi:MAG: transposase [Candidatus Muiribacteriaceae bacterium]